GDPGPARPVRLCRAGETCRPLCWRSLSCPPLSPPRRRPPPFPTAPPRAGSPRPGTRSSASTPRASTGWPTACRATPRTPRTSPSPEHVYTDTHLDPQIQAALDALSPEFRVAVVLCDIEGLTYEEIAATLGIKLGTVRSRIHRGRVQLRATLAHLNPHLRAD